MKEHPIIFSGPMVKAILDGRKTMTRRIVKKAWDGLTWAGDVHPARVDGWIAWWPSGTAEFTKRAYEHGFPCPYGIPGDRLWVWEAWCLPDPTDKRTICYRASGDPVTTGAKWKPSIHMPGWASRITLEIVSVRVERLQEITEEGAIKEGITKIDFYRLLDERQRTDQLDRIFGGKSLPHYVRQFASLWDSLNGKKHPWSSNPWVWVIEFKKIS